MVNTEPDGQSVNIPTLPMHSDGVTKCIRYGALLNLTLTSVRCSLGKSGEGLSNQAHQADGKIL